MWKSWTIPREEGTRAHRIGASTLYVGIDEAGDGYVLTALVRYQDRPSRSSRAAEPLPPFADLAWTRRYMGAIEAYQLNPGYPSIPICVKLRESFLLGPGDDVQGWIFSHLEARVCVDDSLVGSFPLRKPYKTLYGTPDAGVICRYDEADFLASREPTLDSLHGDPTLVAHPVRLKNTSAEPILVSDLCIYGEQLSIYAAGSHMQSERLAFSFNQSGVRMSLDGQGLLPPGSRIIARPKVSGEERFIERSFELLRAMTRL